MSADRERAVTEAFVALARSLADGVDPVDLLIGLSQDATRLLDVASTGILLADPRGVLHVAAASSEATRTLDVFQLQRDQGPCLDCYHSGAPVSVADLRGRGGRWPLFVEAATEAGFASVHAVPLRLRDNVLGTMGLFGAHVGALDDDDLGLGQALAYVAAVAIVQDKVTADKAAVNEQLQIALNSRVVLEQAKGVLAQRGNLEMDRSFAVLRRYARDHNLRLTDAARAVAGRELPAQYVLGHALAGDAERRRPRRPEPPQVARG
jgi:GAF domain-containing protein